MRFEFVGMYQIACPTCKALHPWISINRDQRCYKCKYAATDIQRMPAQAPDVSLEPPEPEPTLDEKIATHLAPEPGGGVELQDKINSLELRIEQLNDDYDSQEAFIDMQAEQLRKAKNMIARIALAAGLYLSEDFEVYS